MIVSGILQLSATVCRNTRSIVDPRLFGLVGTVACHVLTLGLVENTKTHTWGLGTYSDLLNAMVLINPPRANHSL